MIPFRGKFDVKLRNFFPFNQVAFLATLLFRHRSNLDFPEEVGIPRSGPLRVPPQRKNVDPTGTAAGKNVCKPNSKQCLGRSTWPYAVFSRLKTNARDVLRNRYEQMRRTKALRPISSAASPISRKGDWTTHFQIGPTNPSTGWNLKIITSQ